VHSSWDCHSFSRSVIFWAISFLAEASWTIESVFLTLGCLAPICFIANSFPGSWMIEFSWLLITWIFSSQSLYWVSKLSFRALSFDVTWLPWLSCSRSVLTFSSRSWNLEFRLASLTAAPILRIASFTAVPFLRIAWSPQTVVRWLPYFWSSLHLAFVWGPSSMHSSWDCHSSWRASRC